MKSTMINFLLLTTITLTSIYSFNDPFNRYYARVKKNNINVRARPTTSSEIMMQLKKGQDILIIDESGDWIKIKPNENFNAYVHKDLVENGLILKDNVNIRSGPTLSSSILGKLSEGDPVMIKSTIEDWIEIEMPRGFGFWIAKFLVKFLCPEDSYAQYIVQEKEARLKYNEAEEFRRKEFLKRYMDVNHDQVIELYQNIIDLYPDTAEAVKAHERIIDAREKKAMARQKKTTIKELRQVLRLFQEAENLFKQTELKDAVPEQEIKALQNKYQYIVDHYPKTKEGRLSLGRIDELKKFKIQKIQKWEEEIIFNENGKISPNNQNNYSNATHLLIQGKFSKSVIAALISDNIDLRAYEKRKVNIEGLIKNKDPLIPYPLVTIKKISLKE